jgi:hypothetical protein
VFENLAGVVKESTGGARGRARAPHPPTVGRNVEPPEPLSKFYSRMYVEGAEIIHKMYFGSLGQLVTFFA